MPFRVRVNDVMVEVDTPEELFSLTAKMKVSDGKSKTSGIIKDFPPTIHIPEVADKMPEFYKQIRHAKSLMLTILEALYKVDSLVTSELKNILQVESTHAFGGAIAGITKVAVRCGIGGQDVLLKEREKANGELRYRLTPSLREVMRIEKERPKPQPLIR